ncbi:MAG: TetR family transcriptional regulator [Acidimicrobiales bacterium]
MTVTDSQVAESQLDDGKLDDRADNSAGDRADKPVGKAAVMAALIQAATELIVSDGTHVSVREIAAVAGVNHGLVHTYFGNKQGLLAAALDEINRRAAADADGHGFPPVDLATRRNGELAKAITRMRLDEGRDLFPSHRVTTSWRDALAKTRPELDSELIDTMVATAATLGLGWAVFADHMCDVLGIDEQRRDHMDAHIAGLVAELGGIPTGD